MDTSDPLVVAYVVFAFVVQGLLFLDFAARNWRPELERNWGWIIYASGLAALALGVILLANGSQWTFFAPPLLFALWAALGYSVDVWRPIAWRNPPRWFIFIPYVGLYVVSLILFWISMWFIGMAYWIAFGVLYGLHTALNVYSHRQKSASVSGEGRL